MSRARLLLLLLAALCGCASPPSPVPAPEPAGPGPAPGFETRSFQLAEGVLHVEVKIPQRPAGRKPVVIGALADEAALLEAGAIVVQFRHDWRAIPVRPFERPAPAPAPPAEPPAERMVGRWLLAAPRPGIVGRGYFAVIAATAEGSVPAIVDLLVTLPEVDPARIGIAGSSTNGFVALEAMIAEPRLAAAVVRVACGDYHTFLRSSSLALDDDPRWLPEGRLELDADYAARLAAQEPIRHADRLPPRPLLMLNGESDRAVPVACALSTAEAFHGAYARAGVPERFRFMVFGGAGHDVGRAAREAALGFWREHLLPAKPGGTGFTPAEPGGDPP